MSLYVLFHVESTESFREVATDLDQFMVETFGEGQERVQADADHLEIVYLLRKPLVDLPQEHAAFFEALENLFALYAHLHPHFTQHQDGEVTQ